MRQGREGEEVEQKRCTKERVKVKASEEQGTGWRGKR